MSSVFDGYERQYCELSAHLSKILTELPGLNVDEYRARLKEVETGLSEAESVTKRMDLEARSLPPQQRASSLAKIRELKSDLASLKRDWKNCPPTPTPQGSQSNSTAISMDRLDLLEGHAGSQAGGADVSMHERGSGPKMMSATARLEHTSERLQQSRRVLVETEDLGVSILEDLQQQRQTLLHARDTLHGVDDSISRARQILSNMAKQATRHKFVAGGICFALLLAIILVIYLKLRGH